MCSPWVVTTAGRARSSGSVSTLATSPCTCSSSAPRMRTASRGQLTGSDRSALAGVRPELR